MSQKSKTSLLGYTRNRTVNNSETLSVPLHFTFTAGARGEGDRSVWGENGDKAKPAGNHAKKPSVRGGRGGMVFSVSQPLIEP